MPQWLIEEALNKLEKNTENEKVVKLENYNNILEENVSVHENVENIITDLERQLCETRAELANALNKQVYMKKNYKKTLKNVQTAAEDEREDLQRKLVHICTMMLEKFGTVVLKEKKILCSKRRYKPFQHYEKFSKRMYKKWRAATQTASQLRQEIAKIRKELNEGSKKYESAMKHYSNLEIELKKKESSLFDLSEENSYLKKKIDETRDWVVTKLNKERCEKMNAARFREIQRSRELMTLKKKSEEDISMIAQLQAKLHRSEAANANKGSLLNNYKSQLSNFAKEKEILSNKIKDLELENNTLKSTNSQLRANLTLLNDKKEKLNSETEKLEMDTRNRFGIHTKFGDKYEQSKVQKMNAMRTEYEKEIELVKIKLNESENMNIEFHEAVKSFLKKIYEHNQERDAEYALSCSEASEREAHETVCEILNISPGKLTGFLKGCSSSTIDTWLSNLKKMTSKNSFAEDLAKFLFNRAIGNKNEY